MGLQCSVSDRVGWPLTAFTVRACQQPKVPGNSTITATLFLVRQAAFKQEEGVFNSCLSRFTVHRCPELVLDGFQLFALSIFLNWKRNGLSTAKSGLFHFYRLDAFFVPSI